MPSTQPYGPTYDFAGDTAAENLINAQALQSQLDLIAAQTGDLIAALSVSIRDDNTLTDGLVRLRNLHQEVQTVLDSVASGTVTTQSLFFKLPVVAISTANIASLFGLQTIDGVSVPNGGRVLLKNQTTESENGLWIVNSAAIWTRPTDLVTAAASGQGWAVIAEAGGTLNGETAWAILTGGEEADQPVVDTDPLVFFPVFAYFPISIAHGGTGAATAATARTALGAAGKYTTTITGDDATTVFTVTHNLGSAAIVASIQAADGSLQDADFRAISATQMTVTFTTAPASTEVITVTVIG